MQQKKSNANEKDQLESSISVSSLSGHNKVSKAKVNSHQVLQAQNYNLDSNSNSTSAVFENPDEQDSALPICTVDEIKSQERKIKLRAQAFLRKHASMVKTHLLLGALNLRLQNEGRSLSSFSVDPLQEEVLFFQDLGAQQRLESFSRAEAICNKYVSAELPILFLHENPILINYFKENFQLLFWLERLHPQISKEWKEIEFVKPCYIQVDSQIQEFSNDKYPHFCYHKYKKLMHMKKLEDQAQNLLDKEEGMSEKNRMYIIEAVRTIKIQKGNKPTGIGAKIKLPKIQDFEKKDYCCPRITIGQDNKDQKQDPLSQSSLSSSNSYLKVVKKRLEKNEQVLTCYYCRGSFHLSCMMDDPKWNGPQIPQKPSGALPKLGKRKLNPFQSEDYSLLELGLQVQQQKGGGGGKKACSVEKWPTAREMQDLRAEFLMMVGYTYLQEKWICKNCALQLVLNHLAYPEADSHFATLLQKSHFYLTNMKRP